MAVHYHAKKDPFVWFFVCLQGLMLILYGLFVDYDTTATVTSGVESDVDQFYPMFQDIHVMIFVGFGFLMTFLRKYSFSAVGLNFLVAALAIQWGILCVGFWEQVFADHWDTILLNIKMLIEGDFAAGAVLISFGACLGKISPLQLMVMAICEIFVYALNFQIGCGPHGGIQAVDMGGSMMVHSFGAYFGLAVSWMMMRNQTVKDRVKAAEENNASVYHSDMFAMIGTLFLWMFWPSFNGALAPAATNSQHRVVINTVLALTGSCMASFVASRFFHHGKFDMVDIQNASLAGGVAVGSSSDLVIGPAGAITIGMVAGFVSVFGYKYISPWLEKKFSLNDTCGVHNLHGMPGVLGAIGGAISASAAGSSAYGTDIGAIFPARAGADGATAGEQAGRQLAALFVTLGMSIVGGLITGKVLLTMESPAKMYADDQAWETPEEETPFFFAKTQRAGDDKEDVEKGCISFAADSPHAIAPAAAFE